jgi:hypothetical protein
VRTLGGGGGGRLVSDLDRSLLHVELEYDLQLNSTWSPDRNDLLFAHEMELLRNSAWAGSPGNGQSAARQTVMQHKATKMKVVSLIFTSVMNWWKLNVNHITRKWITFL